MNNTYGMSEILDACDVGSPYPSDITLTITLGDEDERTHDDDNN